MIITIPVISLCRYQCIVVISSYYTYLQKSTRTAFFIREQLSSITIRRLSAIHRVTMYRIWTNTTYNQSTPSASDRNGLAICTRSSGNPCRHRTQDADDVVRLDNHCNVLPIDLYSCYHICTISANLRHVKDPSDKVLGRQDIS